jgi:hypothetical protein
MIVWLSVFTKIFTGYKDYHGQPPSRLCCHTWKPGFAISTGKKFNQAIGLRKEAIEIEKNWMINLFAVLSESEKLNYIQRLEFNQYSNLSLLFQFRKLRLPIILIASINNYFYNHFYLQKAKTGYSLSEKIKIPCFRQYLQNGTMEKYCWQNNMHCLKKTEIKT